MNKAQEQLLNNMNLSPESSLFRYTLPEYLKTEDGGIHFLYANDEATEIVIDIYNQGHKTMAKNVGTGLAFTTETEEEFSDDEKILVEIKINQIIDMDGLIYKDVSTYTGNSLFCTIPGGKIEVKVIGSHNS